MLLMCVLCPFIKSFFFRSKVYFCSSSFATCSLVGSNSIDMHIIAISGFEEVNRAEFKTMARGASKHSPIRDLSKRKPSAFDVE